MSISGEWLSVISTKEQRKSKSQRVSFCSFCWSRFFTFKQAMTGGDTAITTNVAAAGPANGCQKHLESSLYPFYPEEKLQREFCFSIPQFLFHKYTPLLVNLIPPGSALNVFLLSFNINHNKSFSLPLTHNLSSFWKNKTKQK